jgi:hypothetical protein
MVPAISEDVLTVLVAFLCGSIMGAEREWRRHPGGLRSCALVAGAACVFARIGVVHGGANPGAALGAIATGVGFLGAGVILRRGEVVRGLSTSPANNSGQAQRTEPSAAGCPLAATLDRSRLRADAARYGRRTLPASAPEQGRNL